MITQADAQIKDLVGQSITIISNIANELGKTNPDFAVSRNAIEAEWIALCLYVSGADKNISNDEIELLNYIFDYNLSPNDISNLVSQVSGMYGTLTSQPGITFSILKVYDQVMGNNDTCKGYISAIGVLLNRFAGVDGNVDPSETQFINNYIAMLSRNM